MAFMEELVCEETIKMAFGNLARTYRDRNNLILSIMVDRFSSRIYNPKLFPVKMNSIVVS